MRKMGKDGRKQVYGQEGTWRWHTQPCPTKYTTSEKGAGNTIFELKNKEQAI